MSAAKSIPVVWRDAIRDSDLDRTCKLVAHTLSTWMNKRGEAWPSQQTIAKGASVSDRTVHHATVKLESAGYLLVIWSTGGRHVCHRYQALLPETANALRRIEWNKTANLTAQNPEPHAQNPEPDDINPERRSHESVKKAKSKANGNPEPAAGGSQHEDKPKPVSTTGLHTPATMR